MIFVRSLIAYQGNKWSLLRSLRENVGSFSHFHDVFGGSATVSINMVDLGKVIYNDHDPNVYGIFKCLKSMSVDEVIAQLDKTIKKHKLGRRDDAAYTKFRSYYNRNRDPFLLWVLSKHSFSSLIRFNSDGDFNMPFGKRSPQKSEQRDYVIAAAHKRLRKVKLHNKPYLKYIQKAIEKADDNHVFYFDPPYLASGDNVYHGIWTEADDIKLMELLDYMDRKGLRWMLSNVTQHRQHKNRPLIKWLRSRKYTVINPQFNRAGEGYILNRATTSDANKTVEVLVKNY